MSKRIIYIGLGVLGIAALIALLWWIFRPSPSTTPQTNLGTPVTQNNTGGTGTGTNIGSPIIGSSGGSIAAPNGSTAASGSLTGYKGTAGGSDGTYTGSGAPSSAYLALYGTGAGVPGYSGSAAGNGSINTGAGGSTNTGVGGTPYNGNGSGAGVVSGSGTGSTKNGGDTTYNGNGSGAGVTGYKGNSAGNGTTNTNGGSGGSSYNGNGAGQGVPGYNGNSGGSGTTNTNGGSGGGGQLDTPNVDWLSGSPNTSTNSGSGGGNTRGNSGTVFNPTGINQVANGGVDTTGVIPNFGTGNNGQQKKGGIGLLGTALVAGAAGALTCGAVELFTIAAGATAGATAAGTASGAAAGAQAATFAAQGVVETPRLPIAVQTIDIGPAVGVVAGAGVLNVAKSTQDAMAQGSQHASDTTINTFLSCIARTVAKIALNQITNSVVNWINSGFNGSPSFVQNPDQFFTNVADQAAGEFIKGSALSFLCSPFQLQIKIAIANSYANRNAMSCTLTGVIRNINNFMSGDFSSGGWPGLLAFTTVPTNNPYGAFMYANVGLTYYVQTAQGTQQRQLSLANGFLDFKKKVNCTTTPTPPPPNANRSVTQDASASSDLGGASAQYQVCDLVTTTPGTVIQNALVGTENSSLNELGLAKDFDEIISALISQLMTRTLQGLSDLSGQDGYASNFQTPDQQQAIAAAQTVLSEMQADTGYAQQYGGIEQQSISDIQNAQQQLNTLYNCWNSIATGSTTPDRIQTATTNAAAASTTLRSLQPQVDALNNNITNANSSIMTLQTLESQAVSALSTAEVDAVDAQYNSALANGQIYTQTNVTTATQDRTTLQSQLSALNQQTANGLHQCYAY